jgi:hypothetical protein
MTTVDPDDMIRRIIADDPAAVDALAGLAVQAAT